MSKITTNVKNIILFPLNLLYRISPSTTLKILFRLKMKRKLNLKNPTTYNEKLQWTKLNYKNPLLAKLVDKYTVREYVAEKAPELLNALLWQGFDANDIPWDSLPDRFVIKVTHGSGFNIICHNKGDLDKENCVKTLNRWLKQKYLRCYGEWFYGIEKPRIIIEEFLDAGDGNVPEDYKIFCFDGKPEFVFVYTDRFDEKKCNVYDASWNFKKEVFSNYFKHDDPRPKPKKLEEMLDYARVLSEGFPHVRVDLYLVNDKIYFGELTFTHSAGFSKIQPFEFEEELGRLIKLESWT